MKTLPEILYIVKRENEWLTMFIYTMPGGSLNHNYIYGQRTSLTYSEARKKYNLLLRDYDGLSNLNKNLTYKVVGNRVVWK